MMGHQQWVNCPYCNEGYYFNWEYEWDVITRCIHCDTAWECLLEPEEEDESNTKDDEESLVERQKEKDPDPRIEEAHRLSGLFTEELLREYVIGDEEEKAEDESNED